MSVVETPNAGQRRQVCDDLIDAIEVLDGSQSCATSETSASSSSGTTETIEEIAAIVLRAADALADLEALDPTTMDPDTVKVWACGVEQLRRQADATAIVVADHLDTNQPFRADGWFTAKRWLKHTLQLSGPEAHTRIQTARLRHRAPEWARAESFGWVGVAQHKLMAAIAANPRLDVDTLTSGTLSLLIDAIERPFDEFERLARTWEMLADPQGSLDKAERVRDRRDATMRPQPIGGWSLTAVLDDIAGAEFNEIFAYYIDAEFRTDWRQAVDRLGDGNVAMADLRRTEPQRRADALLAMARAAAAAPADSKRPVPTVNLLMDTDTYADWVAPTKGAAVVIDADDADRPMDSDDPDAHPCSDPASTDIAAVEPDGRRRINPNRYHDVICRTSHGHLLHPADVINTSLWAHVRRVVTDSAGVIIDLGRRSRLFTGNARDAVMLLETHCVWTGCDQPTSRCHADHLDGWNTARGPTNPNNGAPLCPRHNYLKETGFTVTRDHHGNWHTHAPEGHEIT